jgi:hypothetical protein
MADDLSDVLARVLEQWKRGLRVAMPGRVVSYDVAKQTVDVEPQIRRELRDVDDDRERVFEALPIVPSVPVCFPRFGQWFVSFPIAAGDFVMLLVADQDLTRWREQGTVVDPYLPSSHHLSDAVALPGIFPASAALEDASASDLVIGQDGGAQIHVRPDGQIHVAGDEALALAANLAAHLDAISADLTAIAAAASTTATNYGSAGKAALDGSNPIPTVNTKGS